VAVIGARPATGIGILPRRPRPVRAPERTHVRHSGAERRQRQASIGGLLATIAAGAGLAFFYLSQSSHVAAVGYEIDDLQAQITALQADQQRLVLEIGSARSPDQILRRATADLKLVPIDASAVSFARPARSAAPKASPAPASSPDQRH
jgi:cell division protein FtsL